MDKIKELIKEGEELRGTFTKDNIGNKSTTDRESVSEWVTVCIRELKPILTVDDPLYKKFEGWINRIGSLKLDDFNELIGVLKGIERTPEEDEEYPYN